MTDQEYIAMEEERDRLIWVGPRWLSMEQNERLNKISRFLHLERESRISRNLPVRDYTGLVDWERVYQKGEFIPVEVVLAKNTSGTYITSPRSNI